MRKRWAGVLAAAMALAAPVEAAAEVALGALSPNLRASGSLRSRVELHDFFDPDGTANDDYAFGGFVLRAGLAWKSELFDLLVEGQNSSLVALPDDASAPPPQGALGLGATYYGQNRRRDDTSVFLKQGYATMKSLGVPGLAVKGGRFEFSDGGEVVPGEPTLDWLRANRIAQRLIGPFAFAHVGRAFDGASVAWTAAPFHVTGMASHPTQGGFDLGGMDHMADVDLAYLGLNLTRPPLAPGGDGRLFWVYYADGRGLLKVDNRPAEARGADRRHIEVHTQGGHWLHVVPTAAGTFDGLVWGALQRGDWGLLDHRADAWDVEAGWQPPGLPWKPWLRIGFGRTSGDDDPGDGDHGTFFQVLPTPRIYSYSTFYNLMNDQDAFVSLLMRPAPGLVSRTEFHDVRVTEGADLWYQGGGATVSGRDAGFGYAGRPAGGDEELMRVVETTLSYEWSPNLSFAVYYAHLFGGDVVKSIFTNETASFGFLEVTVKL